MAEAIGLAASISGLVTIGAQLGLVAIKLRGLREKFRTVPKVLERTIQEVALLELHIELLKRSMNGSRINQLIVFEHDAVIQMCLTSLHGIVKVLDDHERRLRKSEMYGKLMFLVSDSDMKELSDELERGKTNLVLATQLLAEARRAVDHEELLATTLIHHQQIQSLISHKNKSFDRHVTGQSFATSELKQSEEPYGEGPIRRGRLSLGATEYLQSAPSVKERQYRLSARIWNTVFSFAACKASGGWKAQIWTYNIVSPDSEIFRFCKSADLTGVRRLIDEGKASPLDVCIDVDTGVTFTTLQFVAIKLARTPKPALELLRYLSDNCKFPDREALARRLTHGWVASVCSNSADARSIVRHFDDAVRSCKLDLIAVDPVDLKETGPAFRMSPLAARYSDWGLHSPDALELLSSAASADFLDDDFSAADFLQICDIASVNENFAKQHRKGRSALHLATNMYRRFNACPSYRHPRNLEEQKNSWSKLMYDLIHRGADVHLQDQDGRTPLHSLLDIYLSLEGLAISLVPVLKMLQMLEMWLTLLRSSGIDLRKYWEMYSSLHFVSLIDDISWSIMVNVPRLPEGAAADLSSKTEVVTITISGTYSLEVFILERRRLPGAWATDPAHVLPDKILWRPTREEEEEGKWSPSYTHQVDIDIPSKTSTKFCQEHHDRIGGDYNAAMTGSYDDSVTVMLCSTARRCTTIKRRASSQPRLVATRGSRLCSTRTMRGRRWMPHLHMCSYDHKRRPLHEPAPDFDEDAGTAIVDHRYCHKTGGHAHDLWDDILRVTPDRIGLLCGQCDPDDEKNEARSTTWRCPEHELWAHESYT